MSHDYSRQTETALRLIGKYGRNVNVVTPGTGDVYNPATGQFTAAAPVTTTAKAAFVDFDLQSEVDGSSVLRTDKKVLIAAASLPAAPTPAAKIKDGGVDYAIISVNTIQPGDTAILYEIQARR